MTERTSWTWRHAILKSDLKPTTRHVLLTLSCFMNEVGGGCYPTTKQISDASGLSERAVCQHLELASNEGWIKKQKHGFGGQRWANNEYEIRWPNDNRSDVKGTDPHAEGTDPDDIKALTQGQSKVPITLPVNNECPKPANRRSSYPLGFDEFWEGWRKHAHSPNDPKKTAFTAWKKISADDHDALVACLPAYFRHLRETQTPKAHASTFINQRRWEGFEEIAKAETAGVTIHRGTPEWEAWLSYKRALGKPTKFFEQAEVYTVETPFPPNHGTA